MRLLAQASFRERKITFRDRIVSEITCTSKLKKGKITFRDRIVSEITCTGKLQGGAIILSGTG